jgi:hypothetical protein
MNSKVLTTVTAALVAGAGVAHAPAVAVAQGPASAIDIDNCNVKSSRNAGGFTWAYCPIVVQAPAGQTVGVRYRVNLSTYKPVSGASYRARSGTLAFTGGGEQTLNVKFAFKRLTVAQVVRRLKVTLSSPTGATILDATATANSVSGTS